MGSGEGKRDKTGVGDYKIQTTVYKINKLQGCIIQQNIANIL